MKPNPLLDAWDQVCQQPVIGNVGHHRTHEGGAAHPIGSHVKGPHGTVVGQEAPAWVTDQGVDLATLHAAHSAHVVMTRRGEDRECATSPARRRRRRTTKAKARLTLAPIARTA